VARDNQNGRTRAILLQIVVVADHEILRHIGLRGGRSKREGLASEASAWRRQKQAQGSRNIERRHASCVQAASEHAERCAHAQRAPQRGTRLDRIARAEKRIAGGVALQPIGVPEDGVALRIVVNRIPVPRD
jgi:hypothetical protein